MADGQSQPAQVFLAYNPDDEDTVAAIARSLEAARIRPWLAAWDLEAGDEILEGYEHALRESVACAFFVGSSGPELWQVTQLKLALTRRLAEGDTFRVIPVLLPGGKRGLRSQWPDLLENFQWVEFGPSLNDQRALRRLINAITRQPTRPIERPPTPDLVPYPGLRSFEVDEAGLFFGREARLEWLLSRMRASGTDATLPRFLALVGPSGCGKSSLARAGLIAQLRRGALPDSERWPVAICRPGYHPVESLAIALCEAAGQGDNLQSFHRVRDALLRDERGLDHVARIMLRREPPERRLVVLVDQFEECFTLCSDEAERRALIANLVYAAREPGAQSVVIITMRADFYGSCAAHPALAKLISDYQDLVPPLTRTNLLEAIRRPVLVVGAALEAGLEQRLISDFGASQGGLPLLQFALRELWERRDGALLTNRAYDAIDGIGGAITRQATAVYEGLDRAGQEVCRRLMLELVQPADGDLYTRRRVRRADLAQPDVAPAVLGRVIQALIDARLVTSLADERRPNQAVVEIAHEALIAHWPLLRSWLDRERSLLLARRQLGLDAARWVAAGRKESFLYRGDELVAANSVAGVLHLSADERAFLKASEDTERRARRRWSATVGGLIVLGVLVLLIGAYALVSDMIQRAEIQALKPLWQAAEGGQLSDPILALAPPTDDGRWFIGTETQGVGRRTQGGEWQFSQEGLPTTPSGEVLGVNRLAVDQRDPARLIAAVLEAGAYYSDDGGVRWLASAGLPAEASLRALSVSGDLALTVTAGSFRLFTSGDGGATWEPAAGLAPDLRVYDALLLPGGEVAYIATAEGVFRAEPPPPGQPWVWRQEAGLPPSLRLAAGPAARLVLATTRRPAGNYEIYRWQAGQLRLLCRVNVQPYVLAARPEGAYILLEDGRILVAGLFSDPLSVGSFTGLRNPQSVDMLALPGPGGQGTRLLVGSEQGLQQLRLPLGGEQ